MTDRQRGFARALAQFLCGNAAHKSIELEMGKPHAQEWAALRATTPLFGYPTVEEAEKVLAAFLFGEKPARATPKDR